jgi:hypothetical protein
MIAQILIVALKKEQKKTDNVLKLLSKSVFQNFLPIAIPHSSSFDHGLQPLLSSHESSIDPEQSH